MRWKHSKAPLEPKLNSIDLRRVIWHSLNCFQCRLAFLKFSDDTPITFLSSIQPGYRQLENDNSSPKRPYDSIAALAGKYTRRLVCGQSIKFNQSSTFQSSHGLEAYGSNKTLNSTGKCNMVHVKLLIDYHFSHYIDKSIANILSLTPDLWC